MGEKRSLQEERKVPAQGRKPFYIFPSARCCVHTDQLFPLTVLVRFTIPHHTKSPPLFSPSLLTQSSYTQTPRITGDPAVCRAQCKAQESGDKRHGPKKAKVISINEEGSQEIKHALLRKVRRYGPRHMRVERVTGE